MKNPRFFTLFVTTLCLFCFQVSFSQAFDTNAELAKKTHVPNSPEAQAFTKYGNVPVNMYHGTPNIQVPIYTHKGRELDLPINLTYDGSAIKVNQVASQTGLGWNLNVGGRISRVTNGFPDDFHGDNPYVAEHYFSFWDLSDDSSPSVNVNQKIQEYSNLLPNPSFPSKQELVDYYKFLYNTNKNRYDTQLDYYSFSALGYNETFIIDVVSREAKSLDNPRTKIEITKESNGYTGARSPIESWTVTMEDGTKFYFNQFEVPNEDGGIEVTTTSRQDTEGDSPVYGFRKVYTSSWLLTKIESPTGKDIYTFHYDYVNGQKGDLKASNLIGVKNIILDPNNQSNNPAISEHNLGYSTETYTILKPMLSRIEHNEKQIVLVDDLNERWDVFNTGIDKITIYSEPNVKYKSFDFKYGYFRSSDENTPRPYTSSNPPNAGLVRLKLEGIDILDKSEQYVSSYYFNYNNPCDMPRLASMGMDYYGYNNGNDCMPGTNNCVLYPPYNEGGVNLAGNLRSVNTNASKIGMLSKITYPTGGATEFLYESNYVSVATGTANEWQHVVTAQVAYPTSFPPVNPNACNFKGVTPVTDIQSFSVPLSRSHKLTYTIDHVQDPENNSDFPPAYIVKVSSPSTVLEWGDIFDASCNVNPNIDLVWSLEDIEANSTDYIALDPGDYKLVVMNRSSDYSFTLQVEKGVGVTVYTPEKKAGLRIKEIKDFTAANVLATHKTYNYENGTIISNPRYMYIKTEHVNPDENPGEPVGRVLYRYSYASGTEKPHIGYGSVHEIIENILDPDKSVSTSHSFYTSDNPIYPDGAFTYYINEKETGTHYSVDYKLGKSKTTTTQDAQGKTITTNTYVSIPITTGQNSAHIPVQGIHLQVNEDLGNMYPIAEENDITGDYYIKYVPPMAVTTAPVGGYNLGYIEAITPNECMEKWGTDAAELCTPEMARLVRQVVKAWPKIGDTEQQKITQNMLTQITDFEHYGQDQKFLLKHKVTTNSKGQAIKQAYTYPENYQTNQYQSLKNNNMLSTPIETKTYKNDVLMATQITGYTNDEILPHNIMTSKGMETLQERLVFEEYRDGNLVQARQKDGTPISYVWGHDLRYVVAKVENATYADIEGVLGVGFSIDGGLSINQENQLRGLPNTLVSTYTYEPNIGVISMTDANRQIVYYNYDDQHRLTNVKDDDQRLLKEYNYNYKSTTYVIDDCDAPVITGLAANYISVSVDNSTNVPMVTYAGSIIGLTGGVEPYSYNWEYSIDGGGFISLGNASSFSLSYNVNNAGAFCDDNDPETPPLNITFRCVIADNNNSTPITLTKVVPATCTNNQQ